MYTHIALTARREFDGRERILRRIVEIAEAQGARVSIDVKQCDLPSLTAYDRYETLERFDCVIVVGGDGTILRVVREMRDLSMPMLTVNRGTLGFLAECDLSDFEEGIPELLAGNGFVEERQLLACCVVREGKTILEGRVLNDAVVHQGAIARLVRLRASADDQFLTTFRSDGLIVATPTGSTAYSLAAGGPIVHPGVPAILITPLNAFALTQKPLVIPAAQEVRIEVMAQKNAEHEAAVNLTLDGQIHEKLRSGDVIIVRTSPEQVRFLRRNKNSFYAALREKLKWGE